MASGLSLRRDVRRRHHETRSADLVRAGNERGGDSARSGRLERDGASARSDGLAAAEETGVARERDGDAPAGAAVPRVCEASTRPHVGIEAGDPVGDVERLRDAPKLEPAPRHGSEDRACEVQIVRRDNVRRADRVAVGSERRVRLTVKASSNRPAR